MTGRQRGGPPQIMLLDFEHVDGARLAGAAALIIAFAGGYFLLSLRGSRP